MTRAELQQQLTFQYKAFNESISLLNELEFTRSTNGKWNAGQHLDHLVRSTEPVLLATRLPHLIIGFLFGKANRPSVQYEALVVRYTEKLQEGGKASGRYIPGMVTYKNKSLLVARLTNVVQKLANQLNKFSEQDLDKFILPHPLLGKVTYREMIYFTIYHAQHHHKLLKS